MKRPLLWISLVILTFALAHRAADAQTPVVTPTPAASPAPQVNPTYPRSSKNSQLAMLALGNVNDGNEGPPPEGLALRQLLVQKYGMPLYRKPSSEELAAILPTPELVRQYRDIIKRPKSGIAKLVPDAGCEGGSRIVVATEGCARYPFPGAGTSFSFRTSSYRMRRLADISLSGGKFALLGELMHGLVTSLGDIPIGDVGLQTPAVRSLLGIKPATDLEGARQFEEDLAKGITRGEQKFVRTVGVSNNTTYLLRSIAYRGTVDRSAMGAPYNELEFDKRFDILIVFRVVEVAADGSVTIIWTELSRAESPKLKSTGLRLPE